MKIILASASPRRVEILKGIISDFEVLPQSVEEKTKYLRPHAVVQDLAYIKTTPLLNCEGLVIGADTLVFMQGRYFPKPTSTDEAKEFLRTLSGRTHYVYTGVCLAFRGRYRKFYDKSRVVFRTLDEEFIENYVVGGSPFDKAGGYGIQDGNIVEKFTGSYTNILGLPQEKLEFELKEFLRENAKG